MKELHINEQPLEEEETVTRTNELEDTREFTEEEAMALKIYAAWCQHRDKT